MRPILSSICLCALTLFASACDNPSKDVCEGLDDRCSEAGATRCSGDAVQTCASDRDNGCLRWSDLVGCGTGEICWDGTCVEEQPLCGDGLCEGDEDETTCPADCALGCDPTTELECADGACVPLVSVCDGTDDCAGGEDEQGCTCDPATELECGDGTCIARTLVCDDAPDCAGGEDEQGCPCDSATEYECADGACIARTLVCDDSADCAGGEDEVGCPCDSATQYTCGDGACIALALLCDDAVDCAGGEDEQGCPCDPLVEYECGDGACIPTDAVCDRASDCVGGEDEAGCPCDPWTEYPCQDGTCIPNAARCDGTDDCASAEDEAGCGFCGDGVCDRAGRETNITCADDCCVCGDGQCDLLCQEDAADCPADCPDTCLPAAEACDPLTVPSPCCVSDCVPLDHYGLPGGICCLLDGADYFAWGAPDDRTCCSQDLDLDGRCGGVTVCNDDGTCDPGETPSLCADCPVTCDPVTEFECADGACIGALAECDDAADCADLSDEAPLNPGCAPCDPADFECGNGICLATAVQCDGRDHCADGSDEAPANPACSSMGCGDGVCDPDETTGTCALDCCICGDGLCDGTCAEDFPSCPADCPDTCLPAGGTCDPAGPGDQCCEPGCQSLIPVGQPGAWCCLLDGTDFAAQGAASDWVCCHPDSDVDGLCGGDAGSPCTCGDGVCERGAPCHEYPLACNTDCCECGDGFCEREWCGEDETVCPDDCPGACVPPMEICDPAGALDTCCQGHCIDMEPLGLPGIGVCCWPDGFDYGAIGFGEDVACCSPDTNFDFVCGGGAMACACGDGLCNGNFPCGETGTTCPVDCDGCIAGLYPCDLDAGRPPLGCCGAGCIDLSSAGVDLSVCCMDDGGDYASLGFGHGICCNLDTDNDGECGGPLCVCGDGLCFWGERCHESTISCPDDCCECGDGFCDLFCFEDNTACPADCPDTCLPSVTDCDLASPPDQCCEPGCVDLEPYGGPGEAMCCLLDGSDFLSVGLDEGVCCHPDGDLDGRCGGAQPPCACGDGFCDPRPGCDEAFATCPEDCEDCLRHGASCVNSEDCCVPHCVAFNLHGLDHRCCLADGENYFFLAVGDAACCNPDANGSFTCGPGVQDPCGNGLCEAGEGDSCWEDCRWLACTPDVLGDGVCDCSCGVYDVTDCPPEDIATTADCGRCAWCPGPGGTGDCADQIRPDDLRYCH